MGKAAFQRGPELAFILSVIICNGVDDFAKKDLSGRRIDTLRKQTHFKIIFIQIHILLRLQRLSVPDGVLYLYIGLRKHPQIRKRQAASQNNRNTQIVGDGGGAIVHILAECGRIPRTFIAQQCYIPVAVGKDNCGMKPLLKYPLQYSDGVRNAATVRFLAAKLNSRQNVMLLNFEFQYSQTFQNAGLLFIAVKQQLIQHRGSQLPPGLHFQIVLQEFDAQSIHNNLSQRNCKFHPVGSQYNAQNPQRSLLSLAGKYQNIPHLQIGFSRLRLPVFIEIPDRRLYRVNIQHGIQGIRLRHTVSVHVQTTAITFNFLAHQSNEILHGTVVKYGIVKLTVEQIDLINDLALPV